MNRVDLINQLNVLLADNNTGDISAADVRNQLEDMINNLLSYDDDINSVKLGLYNPSYSYNIGDYTVYNRVLYRCTSAHTGAWNATKFESCTIAEVMGTITGVAAWSGAQAFNGGASINGGSVSGNFTGSATWGGTQNFNNGANIVGGSVSGTFSGTSTWNGQQTFSGGASISGGSVSGSFSGAATWGNMQTFNGGITAAGGALSGTFTGSPTFSGGVTLTSPTINSGALSGTFTGAPTFSGGVTLTSPTINSGALSGTFTGSPTFSGGVILTSPTINGGALSGTFTGSPTFSGGVTLTTPTINGGTISGTIAGSATFSGSDITFSGYLRSTNGNVYSTGTAYTFNANTGRTIGFTVNGNSTVVMGISTAGDVAIGGATNSSFKLAVYGDAAKSAGGTTWSVLSDARLKDVIGELGNALPALRVMKIKKFKYKDKYVQLPHDEMLGVMADELERFFPQAVKRNAAELIVGYDEDGEPILEKFEDLKTVNTGDVVPLLVRAVQQLEEMNNSLLARIDALEQQLNPS